MATYKDIQISVKKQHGIVVQSCWIAHVKALCGLPIRVSPDDPEDKAVPATMEASDRRSHAAFRMVQIACQREARWGREPPRALSSTGFAPELRPKRIRALERPFGTGPGSA